MCRVDGLVDMGAAAAEQQETERLGQVADRIVELYPLPLFQDLPFEDVASLVRSTHRRRVQRGTVLFLEGDPGDVAYIVLSGCVDLVLESFEGEQLLLQHVGPGQYFGEMALLDDKPRSTTAIAALDCELLTISRHQLLTHIEQHPATMLRLLRAISERVRAADDKIKVIGFLDMAGRLARSLLELDHPAGQRATIFIRHDQLAAMIGATRTTVSSILAGWRSAGYVVTGRGKVVIIDRPALEGLAAL